MWDALFNNDNNAIPLYVIRNNLEYIGEDIRCYTYKLPDDIEKYKEKLDWDKISKYQRLSKKLLRKYKDRLNWALISQNQKLSEEAIMQYEDKVD